MLSLRPVGEEQEAEPLNRQSDSSQGRSTMEGQKRRVTFMFRLLYPLDTSLEEDAEMNVVANQIEA
jgi:hypothetical protein